MVARWGDRVGHLHWGWDLWWRRGGWRVADPPNSPQHLIWEDACKALPRAPDAVFALVRDPMARIRSEHRYQREHRRGTWLGWGLAQLPFSLWLRLMLAMARRHPHAFDNHLRPQSDFVPESAVVFRLEDGLEAALDWLGIDANAPRPHRLKGRAAHAGIAPSDAALIGGAYAADYARFGYSSPDTRAAARPAVDWLAERLAPALVWLDRRGRL